MALQSLTPQSALLPGGTVAYRDLGALYVDALDVEGAVLIRLPPATDVYTMLRVGVNGADHLGEPWRATINVQARESSIWQISPVCLLSDDAPFWRVRIGQDAAARRVIVLGNTGGSATVWQAPTVAVADVLASAHSQGVWGAEWEVSLITSEAGLSSLTDVSVRQPTPAGTVAPFAGATAPPGWLLCNGAVVSRTTYARLFAAIGTTWGEGIESGTFKVPDLRGRTVIGAGQGASLTNRVLGAVGGAETHALSVAEMPSHNHLLTVVEGSSKTGSGYVEGEGFANANTGSTGSGTAHNNMPPFAAMSYIIKT